MSCRICGGEQYEAEPQTTEEHSENWGAVADGRYTGEVIFMPTHLIFDALEVLSLTPTLNEKVKEHVDRRIVQALKDAIVDEGIDAAAQDVADVLQDWLNSNPIRELEP